MTDGRVLIAIKALRDRNGWDPSVSEIAEEIEMSRTTTFAKLDRLRAEGRVALPRRFGGWRLTNHSPPDHGDRSR